MNENSMTNISQTNWEKFDARTDEEIDTSDIPPITEESFRNSKWWKPKTPLDVTVQVDPDTFAWFQMQGEDYQEKMAVALQLYAAAHEAQHIRHS
jgi:uncharacterized protein (DUF4415 family)